MLTYIIVSIISGLLFVVIDMAMNVNPLAIRLYRVYAPIAKTSVNPVAGMLIDLFYGFAMAGLFLLLYASLPGDAGIVKGIGFAVLAWFLRVAMRTASDWMTFAIPPATLAYTTLAGLGEMLALGIVYGLALTP
jgi:hypothetical protein